MKPSHFRRKLLDWHKRHGRHDLPWRQKWDFYDILVSEIMLQQTTVAAVIPYFHRFMKAFPTLESLARAPLESVLAQWAGLGYYARAGHLHKAARMVARDGARPPGTLKAVLALPGVGRYTAGAIMSFAHNKPEALVDGNVARVFARIFGIQDNVKDPKTVEKIWATAWRLLPPRGARLFNSALMDFGATVCRPQNPDCLLCPFFKSCWAARHAAQSRLPHLGVAKARRQVHLTALLVRHKDLWLFRKRPARGLYAGLWEIWNQENPAPGPLRNYFEKNMGLRISPPQPLLPVTHALTHREIVVTPFWCESPGPIPETLMSPDFTWRAKAEWPGLAISSLTKALLKRLENVGQNKGSPKKTDNIRKKNIQKRQEQLI